MTKLDVRGAKNWGKTVSLGKEIDDARLCFECMTSVDHVKSVLYRYVTYLSIQSTLAGKNKLQLTA